MIAVRAAYTSQTCSACGHVAKQNRLSQVVFRCQAFGHTTHADTNAATNIHRATPASPSPGAQRTNNQRGPTCCRPSKSAEWGSAGPLPPLWRTCVGMGRPLPDLRGRPRHRPPDPVVGPGGVAETWRTAPAGGGRATLAPASSKADRHRGDCCRGHPHLARRDQRPGPLGPARRVKGEPDLGAGVFDSAPLQRALYRSVRASSHSPRRHLGLHIERSGRLWSRAPC